MRKNFLLLGLLLVTGLAFGQVTTSPDFATEVDTATSTFVITTPEEALKHIGELVVIEGEIVQVAKIDRANGKPTFLNMFLAYPHQPFSVIIFEDHLEKFLPKENYLHKRVRVSGRLRPADGDDPKRKPAIYLRNTAQLKIIGESRK